ncbi:MobV family relaxase [Shewanella sp. 125m-1]
MSTTILRFQKHKHFANIRNAGAHQYRHHALTPNAEKSRVQLNRTLIGSSNLVNDVKKRLGILTKQPRKNAVLAMDGVLTLSPDLFNTGTKEDQLQTLKNFAIASKRWLISTFGDNLVNAVLHRDETSPHIHFTIVPIQYSISGESKLNARDMFNKKTLHDFQRNYFETMHHHFANLLPPNYKAKATHTTLKEFYACINQLDGKMELFFDSELARQKYQLQDKLHESIQQHIEQWLTQIFIAAPDSEREEWIESIKQELERKLDELITMPKLSMQLKTKAKQKFTLNEC